MAGDSVTFSVSAGALFLVLLNAGLAVAGLYLLLRRPEGRWAGGALLAGAGLSTAILGVLVTRFSEMLFGTRLIDIDLYYDFISRPYLLFNALLLGLLLVGIKFGHRKLGGAALLVGLCAAAAIWFAVDLPEQEPAAVFPVFAAAFIAIVTALAARQIRWLAALPLALSALVLTRIVLAATALNAVSSLQVPPGFQLSVYAQLSESPVSMAVDSAGALYVTKVDGTVLKLPDENGDGVADRQIVFADGLGQPLGLAWHAGQIYISTNDPGRKSSGRIVRAEDTDGDGHADDFQDIATGLPSGLFTWHQNNQIAIGPDERLYVGVGSSSDHSQEEVEHAASILSLNLDGSDLRVFATGLRNPFGLAFAPDGRLFATDNGPDRLNETLLYFPVDELNLIVEGGDYGFPNYFGDVPPGSGTLSPAKSFVSETVPTGLAVYSGTQFPAEYRDNVYVALWKQGPRLRDGSFKGLRVARLWPDPATGQWMDEDFVTDLDAPIDVEQGAQGELFVADMNALRIYRVTYTGP